MKSLHKEDFIPPEIYEYFEKADFTIRAPSGKASTCISNYLVARTLLHTTNFRLSTIHGVKGETHDTTMLISNATRNGRDAHWSHWIKDKNSEAARFAYVASSRPRHILVWCVKKLKPTEQTELINLGFDLL